MPRSNYGARKQINQIEFYIIQVRLSGKGHVHTLASAKKNTTKF